MGHGPTSVRRSRFHDCADWDNRVATARAIGPKTADQIRRRSRRSASKAGRAVYLFSLHTIYRVLRISLMHLMQSVHQDRSDHFVQHGQRIIPRIFFWSNCAHRATRDRAASVGPNPPRRNAVRRRSKERLMAAACSRGAPTAMHVPAPLSLSLSRLRMDAALTRPGGGEPRPQCSFRRLTLPQVDIAGQFSAGSASGSCGLAVAGSSRGRNACPCGSLS